MRENRQSGSEGGVGESQFRPLSLALLGPCERELRSAALWGKADVSSPTDGKRSRMSGGIPARLRNRRWRPPARELSKVARKLQSSPIFPTP